MPLLKSKFQKTTEAAKKEIVQTIKNLAFNILEKFSHYGIEIDKQITYNNGTNFREINIKLRLYKNKDG